MLEGGWIKIHRQIAKWEWADSPSVFCLFIHLLLMANWENCKWHGKRIKVGQLVTGRNKLAKATGLTVQQVRTALNKLQSTGEITINSTKQYSIITISNYVKYQVIEDESNQESNPQVTNKQPLFKNNKESNNTLKGNYKGKGVKADFISDDRRGTDVPKRPNYAKGL